MTRRVYLAGPMRKAPEFNFPAFFDEEQNLVEAGLRSVPGHLARAFGTGLADMWFEVAGPVVFNPGRRDTDTGFDPTGMDGHEDLQALGFDLREALHADLTFITLYATEIRLLSGWENSSGARAERAVAEALGLDVTYATPPRRFANHDEVVESQWPGRRYEVLSGSIHSNAWRYEVTAVGGLGWRYWLDEADMAPAP